MAPDPEQPVDGDARTLNMRPLDSRVGATDFTLDLQIGDAFDDYELIAEIGAGGMGRVYKARQKSMDRIVALKTILSRHAATPAVAQRFRKEAAAAGRLDHPGIVPVYGFGEQDGQLYFTMAFVDGQGLDERLRQGPLDSRQAAHVVQKVAEAVGHAHRKGLIHRDLKPGNVLLGRDGSVKVTDFGIARYVNAKEIEDSDPVTPRKRHHMAGSLVALTGAGTVVGTPGFMAPEQASNARLTGPAADIWALGALLYACLTGRAPFLGTDVFETLVLTAESDPVPPDEINPDADAELVEICTKCLRKDPSERFATADAVAEALAQWREGQSVPSRWAVWHKRAARFAAGAPELLPLLAGLVVNRLANVQEGIFVGCALAGLGLANRRKRTGLLIAPAVCTLLLFAAFGLGWLLPGKSPWIAGGVVSVAGVLAIAATLQCGLSSLEPARSTRWSAARIGVLCIPLAILGGVASIALALSGERALLEWERTVGRLGVWFLAAPSGLAVGALLGRLAQSLERRGRASTIVLQIGAALYVIVAVWLLREARPDSVTETARFSFAGPGPALAFADDRAARWLASPAPEARWAALAGIIWLKMLLLAVPLAVGALMAALLERARAE